MNMGIAIALFLAANVLFPGTEALTSSQSVEARLNQEAQAQAEVYWNKFLTKCGDSYIFALEYKTYSNPNAAQPRHWYEGKQPRIRVVGEYYPPKRLTEAQRLNNVDPQPIEWRGKVVLTFRVGRQARSRGIGYDGPGPWRDNYEIERSIIKEKGQWSIYESPKSTDVKVPCTELAGSPDKRDSTDSSQCEHSLGMTIKAKWIQVGGEHGVLGCPNMNEAEASQSPQGTIGRYVDFKGGAGYDPGTIHLHTSGRHRGTAFITRGAIFALYKSLGGSSSWLGFPISDEYDFPGGRRSNFEGGYIHWDEQTGQTRAYKY